MSATHFEQRRNEILAAVVEAYITTSSPVGSELISRKMRKGVSSATVRNVMVELEEAGLLEQPHTSAGRVPTDRGYRYYVDLLMHGGGLSAEESRRLNRTFQAESERGSLLERVGVALAELAHQAAFVIAPTVKHSAIKQIELLPLGVHKLLCVLVGQDPIWASHTVELHEPISRDEAISLAHFLNTELAGRPAQEWVVFLERRLLVGNDSFYHLVKRSLAILQAALAVEPDEQVFIEGTTYLFEHPEFHNNPKKAYELLRQLELQEELLDRWRADLPTTENVEGACVRIGHEVGIVGLDDCSYVLAPFAVQHVIVGGVGIVGPKRMDYRRMRALVEAAAGAVTEALNPWDGPAH